MGWEAFGGLLQLVGVGVVAYGVMSLRFELEGERSALGHLQRWGAGWAAHSGDAASWARRRTKAARRWVSDLWLRLQGTRPPVRLQARSGTATVSAAAASVGVGHAPPVRSWESMGRDKQIEDLHRRVGRLDDRAGRLEGRQRRDRQELEDALAETRDRLEHLHKGGLSVEAWGLQLIAVGIFISVWSEWVASAVVVQALLLGWGLLAAWLWATSEDRRWCR